MLGMEPKAFLMLGKHLITELLPQHQVTPFLTFEKTLHKFYIKVELPSYWQFGHNLV
jgi:hypothetical protein